MDCNNSSATPSLRLSQLSLQTPNVVVKLREAPKSAPESPSSASLLCLSLRHLMFFPCPLSISLFNCLSCLSSPAQKDRDRERDQAGSAPSQTLDVHPGLLCYPGMTISQWGPNLTFAPTTSSFAAPPSSLGHSLCHNSSSGWVSLPCIEELFLYLLFYWGKEREAENQGRAEKKERQPGNRRKEGKKNVAAWVLLSCLNFMSV